MDIVGAICCLIAWIGSFVLWCITGEPVYFAVFAGLSAWLEKRG